MAKEALSYYVVRLTLMNNKPVLQRLREGRRNRNISSVTKRFDSKANIAEVSNLSLTIKFLSKNFSPNIWWSNSFIKNVTLHTVTSLAVNSITDTFLQMLQNLQNSCIRSEIEKCPDYLTGFRLTLWYIGFRLEKHLDNSELDWFYYQLDLDWLI